MHLVSLFGPKSTCGIGNWPKCFFRSFRWREMSVLLLHLMTKRCSGTS